MGKGNPSKNEGSNWRKPRGNWLSYFCGKAHVVTVLVGTHCLNTRIY